MTTTDLPSTYDRALWTAFDDSDPLTPFERATDGYSIGWTDDRFILQDPTGVIVTDDLDAIVTVLCHNHPLAVSILARRNRAHRARLELTEAHSNKEHHMPKSADPIVVLNDPDTDRPWDDNDRPDLNGAATALASREAAISDHLLVDDWANPARYDWSIESHPLTAKAAIQQNRRLAAWISTDADLVLDRGRVPLDIDAVDGRPKIRAGVDMVVFVAVPQGDRAYRPTGEVDPTGGECAALLMSPRTYQRDDGSTGASWDSGRFRAVRFFSSLDAAEEAAEELRRAVWDCNEANRLAFREQMAEQDKALRAAGLTRYSTEPDTDLPF